jgi:hypothetical protein
MLKLTADIHRYPHSSAGMWRCPDSEMERLTDRLKRQLMDELGIVGRLWDLSDETCFVRVSDLPQAVIQVHARHAL